MALSTNLSKTSEPVWSAAVIQAFVVAVIGLVVAFGLDLSDTQQDAILGLTAVLAPFVAAWRVRKQVTPT